MQNTLLLVDGSSYLYRAFHALPDLRNSDGMPTGALYGIINMLRRLRQDFPTAYMACVFDAKGKTFRDDLYSDYKAHRPPMPPDLVCQIEPIYSAIHAMGWPILTVDGVEADDVIGTLAVWATQEGMQTVISTGDKDLAQLVNSEVQLINTMSNERLNIAGVEAKFGVLPEKIVDYLSLIGDTADNVPGVAKVGPKTAVKWLKEYGSLDGIIEHAHEIKGVVGDNLRAVLDWLPKARILVTVKTDCDLSLVCQHISNLVPHNIDTVLLHELFLRYGFKTWLRELEKVEQVGQTELVHKEEKEENKNLFTGQVLVSSTQTTTLFCEKKQYDTILTESDLLRWLEVICSATLTSIDTETTSLDPLVAKLVGISFCCEPGLAAYIPLAHDYPAAPLQLTIEKVLSVLKPWLESKTHYKVGQNLKYDRHVLANYGITLEGVVHDTLLQSYVIESHKNHGMDNLALRYLNHQTMTYESVCGKGAAQIGFNEVDIAVATDYAAEDADVTLQLHQLLYPKIEKEEKLDFIYRKIELPTAEVLWVMERCGVLVDVDLLNQQSHTLGSRLLVLEQEANTLAGQIFNLNSPKQLSEILFDKLKLPVVKKTPSGVPSTDEEVLQKLAQDYPLPKILLEYRGLSKLKSTYTDKLPKMVNPQTGRVHTNYAQAVAVTGRLASNDPNLQNIPIKSTEGRRIREAFIAPEGAMIISADYSQIELRIMAHISEDRNLLSAFERGEDVHQATAAEIFGVLPIEVTSEQRRYAKVINFGLIYGMSAFGLASNLGISRAAAQNYIDTYFTRYPGVAQYMANAKSIAKEKGYVETVFGRRLWLPEINSPNGPRRQAAERAAINAPMQGTAADIIKLAMIAVQNWIKHSSLKTKLIMQVHDELILEVPKEEVLEVQQRLPMIMASVAKLKVPLLAQVGVGKNWDTAH
jgi:DNA polymerase-1